MKGGRIVKEIQVRNFRSLKDTGLQKLSPITLLVGENSSGKSTFLRAFPLLKQSLAKRTSGPILWAGDVDDYVDFGSIEETVTNDGSKTITFRFRFNIVEPDDRSSFSNLIRSLDNKDSAPENSDEIDYEITIASSKGQEFVSTFILSVNSTRVEFDLVKNTILVDGIYFSSVRKKKSSGDAAARGYYGYLTGVSKSFGFSLPSIEKVWDELVKRVRVEKGSEYRRYYLVETLAIVGERLTKNQELVQIDATQENNEKYFEWYVQDYNQILSLLQSDNGNQFAEKIKLSYVYWRFAEIDEYILEYFRQVHYIAPLRATAERYYRLRNLAVNEVDYQGKNLAIFINSLSTKRLKEFHEWTSEHFGFTVSTDKSKGHLSLLIKLSGSDKAINLSDTGFGYSQVLPIITQLWELSSRKRPKMPNYYSWSQPCPLVIAIEQPELHLHPAVQAKLAKAFIACIKLARDNGYELQLLLETHSQTIVDYLGRAIAKGQLNREDVSVILFEKHDEVNITDVKNSNYDEDGYLENWPYGFFDSKE